MELSFVKGILTGIILSLPFGPVGIYCTQLAIVGGQWKSYITALGMVTIDVLYSMIALIFLSKVEDTIIRYENFLSLIIGIFLMFFAYKKLSVKVIIKEMKVEVNNIVQSYFTGLFFALANISTILVLTIIFTTLKVYNDESSTYIYKILLGVLIGGSSLWFITTSFVSHHCKKLNKRTLIKTIKIVNSILFLFSLLIIIKSIVRFFKI